MELSRIYNKWVIAPLAVIGFASAANADVINGDQEVQNGAIVQSDDDTTAKADNEVNINTSNAPGMAAALAQATACNFTKSTSASLGILFVSGGVTWAKSDVAGTKYLQLGGMTRKQAIAELYEDDGVTLKEAFKDIDEEKDLPLIDCLLRSAEAMEKEYAENEKGRTHELKLLILENEYQIVLMGMKEYCASEKVIGRVITKAEHDKYCHAPIDEALSTIRAAKKNLFDNPNNSTAVRSGTVETPALTH